MSARGRKSCVGETSRRSLRKSSKPQYPVPQENFQGKNTKGRIRNSPFSNKSQITVSKEQGESLRYEYDGKVWNIGPAYVSRFQVGGFLRALSKFVQEYNANANQNQKKESIAHKILLLEQFSGAPNNVSSLSLSSAAHDSIDETLSPSRVTVDSAWKTTEIDDEKSGISNQDLNSRKILYNVSTEEHEKCTDAHCNQTSSGTSETQAGCSSSLENGFEMLDLNSGDAGSVHWSKRVSSGDNTESSSPLQLSLRLEKLNLTDMDIEMVMSWCIDMFNEGCVVIRKLWFFGNRIGDAGALAIARFINQSSGIKRGKKDHKVNFFGLREIHLSHNRISDYGAHRILTSISEVKNFETGKPIWLRLEWNIISLANLCDIMDNLYENSGFIVDMPIAAHGHNHCSSGFTLPKYYCSLANISKAPARIENQDVNCKLPNQNTEFPENLIFTSGTVSNKKLKNVIENCHVRMPWINSQYEKPCEANVLREATRLWLKTSHTTPDVEGKPPKDICDTKVSKEKNDQDKRSEKKIGISDVVDKASGPLLFVLDTSAVLSMLEAPSSVALPINFTFKRLTSLSEKKCFGQELPEEQRTCFVIPSCVALQLDALKNDSRAKFCIRRFFGKEIDEWGPSGHNFLTLLGTHEGEGMLVDHQAEIIDSFTYYSTSKGQQIDTRVVEIALFFQTECLRALYTNPVEGEIQSSEIDKMKKINRIPYNLSAQKLVVNHLPVCLITGDNFQAQFARAHGVPSLRTADLQLHLGQLMDDVLSKSRFKPLTSSYLRSILRNTATAGLGPVNARNLQKEFDGSVACLHASMTLVSSYQNRISKALEILNDDSIVDITDSAKIQRACDVLSGDVFSGSCQYFHNSEQVLPSISDNDSIQKKMLASPGEFITRVQSLLEEWQTRSIKSQESVRRVLHWPKSPSQT